MHQKLLLVGLLSASAAIPAANAAVTLVSQTRTITARNQFSNLMRSAPGFGSWSDELLTVPVDILGGTGHSTQNSLITTTRLTASGTIFAEDGAMGVGGHASSSFISRFEVATPQDFAFSGQWHLHYNSGLQPAAQLRLERISPVPHVYHFTQWGLDEIIREWVEDDDVSFRGVFEPGIYQLTVLVNLDVNLDVGIVNGQGNFRVDLQVPSPATMFPLLLLCAGRRRRTSTR